MDLDGAGIVLVAAGGVRGDGATWRCAAAAIRCSPLALDTGCTGAELVADNCGAAHVGPLIWRQDVAGPESVVGDDVGCAADGGGGGGGGGGDALAFVADAAAAVKNVGAGVGAAGAPPADVVVVVVVVAAAAAAAAAAGMSSTVGVMDFARETERLRPAAGSRR